jgi:hypothetical protein
MVAKEADRDTSIVADNHESCRILHGLKLFDKEFTTIPVKLLLGGNPYLKIDIFCA